MLSACVCPPSNVLLGSRRDTGFGVVRLRGVFFAFDGFVASGRRAVVAWREWRCCGDVRRFRWRCFAVACCKFVDNGICRSRGSGRMRGHVEGPSRGESVGESGPCRLPRTCSFSSSQNLRFEHNSPHRRSLSLRYFLTLVVLFTFLLLLLCWFGLTAGHVRPRGGCRCQVDVIGSMRES